MSSPRTWAREHVRDLVPYSAARHFYGTEPDGLALLDANENPYRRRWNSGDIELNRYPDPRCRRLRAALAGWLGLRPERIWLGNGSDEALDLLVRVFAAPGDDVTILSPSYGMYAVAAAANAVSVRDVPLDERFDFDVEATLERASGTRMIFACSPNNPTGNLLTEERLLALAAGFDGPVMVDEAYVEFADAPSLLRNLERHANLIILRTFSKAWGLAGARVGYMAADPDVIDLVNRITLPYPLNTLSADAALAALERPEVMQDQVARIVAERERLAGRLAGLGLEVYPSRANFLLARLPEARAVHRRLAEAFRIVVRLRDADPRLADCLRISVGTPEENDYLCAALEELLA